MLQNNCRIEKFKGFKFYEKDVLYDDYIFTNDIQLTIDVTYITPGFGVALMNNEGYSIKEKSSTYLFKVGYKEASIYYATPSEMTLIKQITCPEASTIQENMKFIFIKSSKKITVYLNDTLIFEEYIKKDLDKYNIGYYSNAGNIINNISISSNMPDEWTVNMKNTRGGYIKFLNDSFVLTECAYPAEIEQSKIMLEKGTYYFKAETEEVDGINDIKYYIHKSDDDRFFDEDKNILDSKNKFTLLKDTEVNIKITGTQGKISKILLSKHKADDYISTTTSNINFEGSYIDVYLQDIKKITWKGIVSRYPITLDSDIIYGVILDNRTAIKPEETGIFIGKDKVYDYEFNTDSYTFKIKKDNKLIYSTKLVNLSNKITIFKNVTGIISEMILYKKNGEVINITSQDENKKYVNANISSPIIVVDQFNTPLDLSSSYRQCMYENYNKFIFTNWEREYIIPEKILKFENKVVEKDDTIIVYGIKKKFDVDLDNIYKVPEDNINSIDLFTKHYDLIEEKDLLYVDKVLNIIYLTQEQIDKYQMIVIDYLKDNSYAINYLYDKHVYEVSVSSNEETRILYDSNLLSSDKKIYQTTNHKITNINGNVNGYIILQRGGV